MYQTAKILHLAKIFLQNYGKYMYVAFVYKSIQVQFNSQQVHIPVKEHLHFVLEC